MSNTSEQLSQGRADSLAIRPASANGFNAASRANPQQEGRRLMSAGAKIKLGRIEADPTQPRKTFGTEADARLAESMRTRGQLVPVLVRWVAEADRYRVIDGERRFRAAQVAGLPELAVVVEEEADPDVILELQLVTNALRDDVAPVEQARAYKRLIDSQGLTRRELAAKLGIDHSSITRALSLLGLPEDVQAEVDAGALGSQTAAVIASKIADPEAQREVARRVVAEKLTRAETKDAVEAKVAEVKAKAKPGRAVQGRAGAPKAKPFGLTFWNVKAGDGLTISAERKRGINPHKLAEALEVAAATIRAELARPD
jgi:ParB family chromosome partitioning protein